MAVPLLTRALPIALRLIRVDLAHFLEEIFRVWARNIGGARATSIPLLGSPRDRVERFLRALRHIKKLGKNARKASRCTGLSAMLARKSRKWQNPPAMKLLGPGLVAFFFCVFAGSNLFAQTMARTPAPSSNAPQLEALIKKLDEQNAKIDTLSQQILKLEQQIANMRPGVMVGESTPSPTASSVTTTAPAPAANGGNSHTVARGETLTSIAKMHSVSVSELQKFNHIENDRKLQIGQTIMIPASPAPGASPSSSPE